MENQGCRRVTAGEITQTFLTKWQVFSKSDSKFIIIGVLRAKLFSQFTYSNVFENSEVCTCLVTFHLVPGYEVIF